MQYKVALLSFFAALAVAAPTPDGLPDGTTCTIDSTTTTKCVDGTCYAVNEGCSSRICAVPSGSQVGSCRTETKRALTPRDGLPDGTTCTIGSDTTTKCVDGTCYAANAGCSSRICAVPSGSEVGTCETATKKRSLVPRDGLPDGTICTIGEGVQTVCKDGTCYGGNAGCSSRNCAIPEGSSTGSCQTATKKREAAPELLEKRCTANGGSCTQLSQCCSGNCEYDSSIGLVCKA